MAVGMLLAGGVTVAASRGSDPAPVRIAAAPAAVPSPGAPAPEAPPSAAARAPFSPPVRLVVPRIGVDAPVQGVGLNPDGTVEVPPLDRPGQVGWYRAGDGPAVLLGHYDTRKGPAVFHGVPGLRPGDRIEVRQQDGDTVSYRVRELRQFAKDAFPTELVYGPTATPQLRLVTCGGTLGRDGHYSDNIVVLADRLPPGR
ncbi:class F sortase [Kitasatospora sp. NA04385]|uniref:class F sortase n=1 Tax=Kitasatospora sp. NA04385 TaxID=2742135 RepID=UPI0015903841|nr:class F sortase [Kitasatospora sp. NA04385]QKW19434.1 class F sortase [Kitasatospora sp. NA04385]